MGKKMFLMDVMCHKRGDRNTKMHFYPAVSGDTVSEAIKEARKKEYMGGKFIFESARKKR